MKTIRLFAVLSIMSLCSCEADFYALGDSSEGISEMPSESEGNGDEGNENSLAGTVTAGEWNDLDNWDFWNQLIDGQNEEKFYEHLNYWSLYPSNRFAVTIVNNDDQPVCGAKVELLLGENQSPVWTSISDNRGSAELWYNITSCEDTDEEKIFRISVNGVVCQEVPQASFSQIGLRMNTIIAEPIQVKKSADIAFIVDATGSMVDEIEFLKDDLLDIIRKAESNSSEVSLRTAALFYRDKGDKYLTRYDDFTTKPKETSDFIKEQEAAGGGDYPEAVHTALEEAMQSLSWEEGNYARIAFLLLDAPPHHDSEVIESIQKSIRLYAEKGIKIIPVAASGVNKSTEFLLRMMAMFTDGTYTFITDHSGVGNEHIVPTVGEYEVEQLNNLIVRLISKYTE